MTAHTGPKTNAGPRASHLVPNLRPVYRALREERNRLASVDRADLADVVHQLDAALHLIAGVGTHLARLIDRERAEEGGGAPRRS